MLRHFFVWSCLIWHYLPVIDVEYSWLRWCDKPQCLFSYNLAWLVNPTDFWYSTSLGVLLIVVVTFFFGWPGYHCFHWMFGFVLEFYGCICWKMFMGYSVAIYVLGWSWKSPDCYCSFVEESSRLAMDAMVFVQVFTQVVTALYRAAWKTTAQNTIHPLMIEKGWTLV